MAVGVCRLEDLDTCRVSSPHEDHSVANRLIQTRSHAHFVGVGQPWLFMNMNRIKQEMLAYKAYIRVSWNLHLQLPTSEAWFARALAFPRW